MEERKGKEAPVEESKRGREAKRSSISRCCYPESACRTSSSTTTTTTSTTARLCESNYAKASDHVRLYPFPLLFIPLLLCLCTCLHACFMLCPAKQRLSSRLPLTLPLLSQLDCCCCCCCCSGSSFCLFPACILSLTASACFPLCLPLASSFISRHYPVLSVRVKTCSLSPSPFLSFVRERERETDAERYTNTTLSLSLFLFSLPVSWSCDLYSRSFLF